MCLLLTIIFLTGISCWVCDGAIHSYLSDFPGVYLPKTTYKVQPRRLIITVIVLISNLALIIFNNQILMMPIASNHATWFYKGIDTPLSLWRFLKYSLVFVRIYSVKRGLLLLWLSSSWLNAVAVVVNAVCVHSVLVRLILNDYDAIVILNISLKVSHCITCQHLVRLKLL